jgi:hypothetical protein
VARRHAAVALLALAAFTRPVAATTPPSTAVVAVVDSGINPYHVAFRDTSPRANAYPGTYLPGYPKNATALRLTLGTGDYWAAVRKDCDRVWSKVRPGRLYWFPGTKIVGAVSFDLLQTGNLCATGKPAGGVILDTLGHGTMTASRAAGNAHGACPACRVVSVQFQAGFGVANMEEANASAINAIRWAATNSTWIDAQSNSWAPLPVYDPSGKGGLFFDNAALTRAAEEVSRKHLAFWSSGNGLGGILGVAGMPTIANAHMTPSAIRVGGQDSGYVETWPGFTPHVVSDACDSWAAAPETTKTYGERVGGGTSAAAPYAAGGAAAELLYARTLAGDRRTGVRAGAVARGRATKQGPLADGVLTLAEWRDVALRTATASPRATADDGPACGIDPIYGHTPVRWADLPAGVPPYPLIGYGALDDTARALAFGVLSGAKPAPDRSAEDAFFAADRQAREAQHTVYGGL